MVTHLEVASTGRSLATNIHVAGTFRERLRGLIGHPALDMREAMLFEGARQVHTFGMSYPIDVVFCDRGWRVVKVVSELRPWRVTPVVRNARYVLELRAGAAEGLMDGEVLVAT